MNIVILTLFILLSFNSVAEEHCEDSAQSPSGYVEPSERFIVDTTAGTVFDTETGLMWQQCELGSSYNADTQRCEGNPQGINWESALYASKESSYAAYNDWFLPNIKELITIVEHHCSSPALSVEYFLFSDIQNSREEFVYWSSTTDSRSVQRAWVVQSSNGIVLPHLKEKKGRVRLVRYAK